MFSLILRAIHLMLNIFVYLLSSVLPYCHQRRISGSHEADEFIQSCKCQNCLKYNRIYLQTQLIISQLVLSGSNVSIRDLLENYFLSRFY